ncbi:MAG: tRNA lysidine(34) synthetase TilS [Lachnospiraceae bacterium]|nr:tRNA lysidine(34) synthetase TilS [Lachnospiraceae bacterium]
MKKVLSFVREHHMIEESDHILAAVSGGGDSVCLLLMLQRLGEAIPMRLSVIHVEHGIRGEASRADADFVRRLCQERGIPCFVYECDAIAYARDHGMGLEEGARALRYELFETCRREQKADKIAVAHNQNDCAETVLFHMARGTGLRGLQGIPPARGNIIRPLLCMERREIEDYLQAQGQGYCTDATNQELVYSRNKLRHQALPVLEEINPKAVGHICQAAGSVAEVWGLLEQLVQEARQRWIRMGGAGNRREAGYFLEEGIVQEPPLVRRTLVMELLGECGGSRKDLTGIHVAQVLGLLDHQVGRRISLPYGMQAYRTYGGIELWQTGCSTEAGADGCSPEPGAGGCGTEPGPGGASIEAGPGGRGTAWEPGGRGIALEPGQSRELRAYGLSISARLLEKKADLQEIPKKKYTKWFDYDKIKIGLLLRNPQPEDYLVIDSQGRTQSLKKYFVNAKVPARQRGEQLVLADGSHVLWAVGGRISEAYKVTGATTRILEVNAVGIEECR